MYQSIVAISGLIHPAINRISHYLNSTISHAKYYLRRKAKKSLMPFKHTYTHFVTKIENSLSWPLVRRSWQTVVTLAVDGANPISTYQKHREEVKKKTPQSDTSVETKDLAGHLKSRSNV